MYNKVNTTKHKFEVSNYFIAKIQVDTSIDAPTIVYAMVKGKSIPWYPHGFDYKVTDDSGNELSSS